MISDESIETISKAAAYGCSVEEMGQALVDFFSNLEIKKIPVGDGRFLWVFEPKGKGTRGPTETGLLNHKRPEGLA
jgi:hypothetical protein